MFSLRMDNSRKKKKNSDAGAMITLVLVFGSIFLLLFGGLLSFILFQYRYSLRERAWEENLEIAEAGIRYAGWHLLHEGDNYDFGGIKQYEVEGESIGQFELEITPPNACFSNAEIRSTGTVSDFSDIHRVIKGIYGKAPLTQYAFLSNQDIWFGFSEEVRGPVHSNGGIRVDGSQNSLFTSSQEHYTCEPKHGCPVPQVKPGIWGQGQGGEQGLWKYLESESVAQVSFTIISGALTDIEQASQPDYYFGPSGAEGYWINFSGEEFNIYRVIELEDPVWGWNMEEWVEESNTIKSYESLSETYSLSADCKPIFVEDKVWISGTVDGRVTVGSDSKIIIKGNIDYENTYSALGLIARQDILIPLIVEDSPLKIKAALVSVEGGVMRYFYPLWASSPYQTHSIQDSVELYGSIISKKDWTFTWVDEDENVISGYRESKMNIDPYLIYQSPPYFPTIGNDRFIDWEEVE